MMQESRSDDRGSGPPVWRLRVPTIGDRTCRCSSGDGGELIAERGTMTPRGADARL
jgi:hypothetical protein